MAKTITIRDEVYRKLMKIKGRNESFSELFERLTDRLVPIEVLKSLRGVVEFEDKGRMLSEISEKRAERRL